MGTRIADIPTGITSIQPPLTRQTSVRTAVLSFIVVFGLTKTFSNYFAGRLSDRFGRKHIRGVRQHRGPFRGSPFPPQSTPTATPSKYAGQMTVLNSVSA